MEKNLSDISINKGQIYETIITTENNEGIKNAAPFGILCKNENEIILRLFKGSQTLKNIINNKKFIVNITENPIIFTNSLIDNLPETYFNNDNSLKDADAFLKCEVLKMKEILKKDLINTSEGFIITAKINEITLNNENVKAFNRGFGLLIEILVDYSRIDIVNSELQNEYLKKFKESKKLIKKVGNKEELKSIELIESKLKEKGFNL